jgi:hypothetical protein
MHRRYFDGLITQVKVMQDQRVFSRDVQEYMNMRRQTIGAYPAIALAEYVAFRFQETRDTGFLRRMCCTNGGGPVQICPRNQSP